MGNSNNIMISVNQPYTKMIAYGYKKVEYRNQIFKNLQKGDCIYFYETKNKSGVGRVIGNAIVKYVIPMSIINTNTNTNATIEQIYNEDKTLYINYAIDNLGGFNLYPAQKYVESIIMSMQEAYYEHIKVNVLKGTGLLSYLNEIREGGNYAILFDDFVACDLSLSEFISVKSNKEMIRPPQNMCRVKVQSLTFCQKEEVDLNGSM